MRYADRPTSTKGIPPTMLWNLETDSKLVVVCDEDGTLQIEYTPADGEPWAGNVDQLCIGPYEVEDLMRGTH